MAAPSYVRPRGGPIEREAPREAAPLPPLVVYPRCPVPWCAYVAEGRPVTTAVSGSYAVLVVHSCDARSDNERHRALVSIRPDGTQGGRLLEDGERFEEAVEARANGGGPPRRRHTPPGGPENDG